MNGFEEFIDFLAAKGVKSFTIELQARELSETQERVIENKLRAAAPVAKHDVPVHRGEPTGPEAINEKAKPEAPDVHAAMLRREGEEAQEAERQRLAKEAVDLKDAEEVKAKKEVEARRLKDEEYERKVAAKMEEQKKEQEALEAEKAAKAAAKAAKKAEKAEKKAEKPALTLVSYESFCKMVNTDDGTVTREDRVAVIDALALDDLLRINNDFSLGLDTDKPLAELREDVAGCF